MHYVGDETLTRADFIRMIRQPGSQANTHFEAYVGVVGRWAADIQIGLIFELFVRTREDGEWVGVFGVPDETLQIDSNSTFTLKASDRQALLNEVRDLLAREREQIADRWNYVTRLCQGCLSNTHTLYTGLTNHAEPEVNYYTQPQNLPQGFVGTSRIERRKATAWVLRGVHGNSAFYENLILRYTERGLFPLGRDIGILREIWLELMEGQDQPPRGITMSTPYPSSIGGQYLLHELLLHVANERRPAYEDESWYDWAVFFYGALMAIQAFPDGNKRLSRVVYALILLSGGVSFIAPTDAYGGRLANMR